GGGGGVRRGRGGGGRGVREPAEPVFRLPPEEPLRGGRPAGPPQPVVVQRRQRPQFPPAQPVQAVGPQRQLPVPPLHARTRPLEPPRPLCRQRLRRRPAARRFRPFAPRRRQAPRRQCRQLPPSVPALRLGRCLPQVPPRHQPRVPRPPPRPLRGRRSPPPAP